jgi:hypothetical protein
LLIFAKNENSFFLLLGEPVHATVYCSLCQLSDCELLEKTKKTKQNDIRSYIIMLKVVVVSEQEQEQDSDSDSSSSDESHKTIEQVEMELRLSKVVFADVLSQLNVQSALSEKLSRQCERQGVEIASLRELADLLRGAVVQLQDERDDLSFRAKRLLEQNGRFLQLTSDNNVGDVIQVACPRALVVQLERALSSKFDVNVDADARNDSLPSLCHVRRRSDKLTLLHAAQECGSDDVCLLVLLQLEASLDRNVFYAEMANGRVEMWVRQLFERHLASRVDGGVGDERRRHVEHYVRFVEFMFHARAIDAAHFVQRLVDVALRDAADERRALLERCLALLDTSASELDERDQLWRVAIIGMLSNEEIDEKLHEIQVIGEAPRNVDAGDDDDEEENKEKEAHSDGHHHAIDDDDDDDDDSDDEEQRSDEAGRRTRQSSNDNAMMDKFKDIFRGLKRSSASSLPSLALSRRATTRDSPGSGRRRQRASGSRHAVDRRTLAAPIDADDQEQADAVNLSLSP